MKQHQLSIQAYFRPEILERILRVVRHRGFRVCAMNMKMVSASHNASLHGDKVQIELTVSSSRPIDLLSAQLSKLMDVACINIQPLTSQHMSQPTSQPISA